MTSERHLFDARKLAMRIRRKATYVLHTATDRFRDRRGAELSPVEFERRMALGSMQVPVRGTLPGYTGPGAVSVTIEQQVSDDAQLILSHRFDLLGSGPTHLVAVKDERSSERRARFAALSAALPKDVVEKYSPIEWHSDFVSGYRWPTDLYYLDVRVGEKPGAEIKIPRELSRFQHVGVLAYGAGERGGLEFLLQTLDWISANPVRRGVNWASTMDVAIRAVNWVWGLRLFGEALSEYATARAHIVRSLYEHGLHIEQNLEFYEESTSNHYLSNVAGLLYLGAALPEFPEADRWLLFGLQELVSEMERQVYPDGADYEASTHYHRLVAEMFVSCAALAERLPVDRRRRVANGVGSSGRLRPRVRPPGDTGVNVALPRRVLPDAFYERLARMVEYTAAITKPNGRVPQLGDNDSGRLHKLSVDSREDVRDHRHLIAAGAALLRQADFTEVGAAAAQEGRLIAGGLDWPAGPADGVASPSDGAAAGVRQFPDAGVAVLRRDSAYLLVTCGPNGQHGRGGHNHNDKGSFELAVGVNDWIVDGGCLVYTADPVLRNRFRGTSAHNTLWIDGLEQDPLPPGMEGLFRLPEQCAPRLTLLPDGRIVAEHSGFGRPHRRTFDFSARSLVIEDTIDIPDGSTAFIGFNFDPDVRCTVLDAAGADCRCELIHAAAARMELTVSGCSGAVIEPGFFSRGYGIRVSNQRLVVSGSRPRVTSQFAW